MNTNDPANALVAALSCLALGVRAWRAGRKGEAVTHLIDMVYHLVSFLGSLFQ
jgi:hypothetical protein